MTARESRGHVNDGIVLRKMMRLQHRLAGFVGRVRLSLVWLGEPSVGRKCLAEGKSSPYLLAVRKLGPRIFLGGMGRGDGHWMEEAGSYRFSEGQDDCCMRVMRTLDIPGVHHVYGQATSGIDAAVGPFDLERTTEV